MPDETVTFRGDEALALIDVFSRSHAAEIFAHLDTPTTVPDVADSMGLSTSTVYTAVTDAPSRGGAGLADIGLLMETEAEFSAVAQDGTQTYARRKAAQYVRAFNRIEIDASGDELTVTLSDRRTLAHYDPKSPLTDDA